ncbi:hypothetical protein H9X96_20690 [Pedobacter sp. N36a]|uniref:hypothetical protein n=1 Tax=Pedobacter sp. N36a TaxID=2767996 RepID=UPI0016572BF4|nr:hypothetical protein [Pedobacter sp. N36a]MBC8988179.1 hypothetical protein [Pedobacter sp. N36a]
MNRKLFTKKILTLVTAIALFVGVGLVYGFTSTEKKGQFKQALTKEKIAPANGWYTITITNPSQPEMPANQSIGSLTSAPPAIDPDGCAQTLNTGNKCAVFLTFTDEDAMLPATVAAANADPEVTVGNSSRSPE